MYPRTFLLSVMTASVVYALSADPIIATIDQATQELTATKAGAETQGTQSFEDRAAESAYAQQTLDHYQAAIDAETEAAKVAEENEGAYDEAEQRKLCDAYISSASLHRALIVSLQNAKVYIKQALLSDALLHAVDSDYLATSELGFWTTQVATACAGEVDAVQAPLEEEMKAFLEFYSS